MIIQSSIAAGRLLASHQLVDMEQTEAQSDIRSSQTEEWTYLAEGGAHLVFAYRGTVPSLRNKVLRVRKSHVESPTCGLFEEGITTFERARGYFANTITPALVPPELLPEEWRVSVRTDWIRALEADSLSSRPKSRTSLRSSLSGDQQSLSDESIEVSLVENLLGAEGDVAIEIKVSLSVSPCAN
jgi:inositol-pentakisphosphate 2-kinase